MRDAGYNCADLMDLQLGWPELKAIGFDETDLYQQLGLTAEMSRPPSIYAKLLVGLRRDEEEEEEDDDGDDVYYL